MSAIALAFDRHGHIVGRSLLERMMATMAHRGADGQRVEASGFAALGHLHFWTTEEEIGERQPLALDRQNGWLAFEGRLDNRDEIWRALPHSPGPLAACSDARLVAAAFDAFGASAFTLLLGPFAAIVIDLAKREAILARDAMGGRSLAFALSDHRLLAASEEAALVGIASGSDDLDENRIARYFALDELKNGRTFFRGIELLLPGEMLRVSPGRAERSWISPPLAPLTRGPQRDGELAEELRSRLRAAVQCRLRGLVRPAVLMSGGLDSTPIAGFASRSLPAGERLRTLSWVFDRHPEADERELIECMVAQHGLEAHWLAGDSALPVVDPETWPTHPSTPEQNAYRRLHTLAYARAEELGVRVVLSGMCGDHLYSGSETWLAEPLQRGAWLEALTELGWHCRPNRGLRAGIRHALAPFTGRTPFRFGAEAPPAWLSRRAHALLEPTSQQPWLHAHYPRLTQARRVLDPGNGHGFAVESYYASRHQLELRYPLRDRRVVELMLSVPTRQIYHRGIQRPILRRAAAEVLPARIRERQGKARFTALFVQGFYEQGRSAVEHLLFRPSATWPQYLDRDWMARAWQRQDRGLGALLLWLAFSLELWLERRCPPSSGTVPLQPLTSDRAALA